MKRIFFFALLGLFLSSVFAQNWCLTLGNFDEQDARKIWEYLLEEGLPGYIIYGDRCELRLGPVETLPEAENLRKKLLEKYHLESNIISEPEIDDAQEEAPGRSLESKNYSEYTDATARKIISLALDLFGEPYKYGGTKPGAGIDCSFFVQSIYKQLGIYLPRTSREQFKVGKELKDLSQLQVGDLLFFKKTYRSRRTGRKFSRINHVGIYIGNGEFIHATRNVQRVTISQLKEPYYQKRLAGIRRVLPEKQEAKR